jgi:dienelactone hydrolase
MREWFISELQESLGISTHDVQMILNYLATRGDIDVRKVGMLGQGSGGAIAILAAAADPRITFVDAINPWGDWPDWLKESRVVPEAERTVYLKSEFLQKVAILDPVKYLPQFTPNRIRIEQTFGDPMTPKDVQTKIAASVSSPESVVQYPDVRTQIHVWMTQNWWLKEQLHPSPTTSATAQFNYGNRASEH